MWCGKHKRLGFILLLSTLQIMSWRSRAGRIYPTEYQGQVPSYVPIKLLEAKKVEEGGGGQGDVHGGAYSGLGTLGSRPPSCEHKCGRCTPCTAIQVPATKDHFRTQYANYEPEGWKCKCGSSFYNP